MSAKTSIETGAVSALCFKKPRAIDLKIASWTIRDEAVTCKQCLRIIEEGGTSPGRADVGRVTNIRR